MTATRAELSNASSLPVRHINPSPLKDVVGVRAEPEAAAENDAEHSAHGERTDKRSSVASPSSCLLATSLAERGGRALPSAAQGEIKAEAQGRPSAQRLLQLRHVILPGGVFACGGDPRGRDGRPGGRQAQVLQDLLHDLLLGDEGEHCPAAAARTDEHVFAEDAQEKLCPGDSGRLTARGRLR